MSVETGVAGGLSTVQHASNANRHKMNIVHCHRVFITIMLLFRGNKTFKTYFSFSQSSQQTSHTVQNFLLFGFVLFLIDQALVV